MNNNSFKIFTLTMIKQNATIKKEYVYKNTVR